MSAGKQRGPARRGLAKLCKPISSSSATAGQHSLSNGPEGDIEIGADQLDGQKE